MAVYFKGGFEDRKGKPLDCEPVDCIPVDCAPVECIPVECTPVIETVIEHHYPISSDEIRYLLFILKKSTFQGDDMENLVVITMKLQEEYKRVLANETKKKK